MTGLVLEGGGHRGIYSAGIMDVLMEQGISFDGLIGVSAGAVFGVSFISGQIRRSITYVEKYCADSRYMGFGSFLKTGDYFNVDFCYKQIPETLVAFDNDAFEKSGVPYYVVCTDVESGEAIYHQCKEMRDNGMKWLQASASMPCVSKTVEVDGKRLLDGGVADSIPLKYFQSIGYEKNVVILTQPEGYKKSPNPMTGLVKLLYRKNRAFVTAFENRHIFYNEELEYLEKEEQAGRVLIVRPSEQLVAGRTEKDPEKIRMTYELGRKDCLNQLNRIKEFCEKN